jgi:hypothetical protein
MNKLQDMQCICKCNIEARSRYHCCRGKAVCITYYECVCVALVIQHAHRMRRIVLSSAACRAPPYLSILGLSHKRQDFRKKKYSEHEMCVLSSISRLSVTFRILRNVQQDITINVHRSSCAVHRSSCAVHRSSCAVHKSSCQTLMKLAFTRQIFEIYSNSKFHENLSSGNRVVPCGRTDGRTDG